jgi:hypothetical protein
MKFRLLTPLELLPVAGGGVVRSWLWCGMAPVSNLERVYRRRLATRALNPQFGSTCAPATGQLQK